jgi:hypothetical protein
VRAFAGRGVGLSVVLVDLDPWDFPFRAGRGSGSEDLGQRLWIFGAGRPEAGLALGEVLVLRHVGRWLLVVTHLPCIDLKGALDYALLEQVSIEAIDCQLVNIGKH